MRSATRCTKLATSSLNISGTAAAFDKASAHDANVAGTPCNAIDMAPCSIGTDTNDFAAVLCYLRSMRGPLGNAKLDSPQLGQPGRPTSTSGIQAFAQPLGARIPAIN